MKNVELGICFMQVAFLFGFLLSKSSTTNAFLPTRRATGTVPGFGCSSTTTTSSSSCLKAVSPSWKDLPLPDLPPQIVNGVKFTTTTLQQQQSLFHWPIEWPIMDTSSFLPEQINTDSLSNVMTTFLSTDWQIEAIVVVTIGNLIYQWLNSPLDFSTAPFEPGTDTYSPAKSDAFYQQRPGMVLKRLLKLGTMSGAFTAGLLFDWLILGKLLKDDDYTALKKAEPKRAKEALRLCEQLGPTFIKLVRHLPSVAVMLSISSHPFFRHGCLTYHLFSA